MPAILPLLTVRKVDISMLIKKIMDYDNVNVKQKLTVGDTTNKIDIGDGIIKKSGEKSLNIAAQSISLDTEDPVIIKKHLGVQSHITATLNIFTKNGTIWTERGNISASTGTVKGKIGKFNDVLINSSRQLKQDISQLSKEEAYNLIEDLEPVKFSFKDDPSKKENIGFIAEQVPDIVSDKDHKSVRYMEIISALTKVVKEQKKNNRVRKKN
jgi:hypothetical protein